MTGIHIYTAPFQRATRFVDRCGAKVLHFRNPSNRLMFTSCCHKKRPAKNLVVQCFYDKLDVWCKEGKGCRK